MTKSIREAVLKDTEEEEDKFAEDSYGQGRMFEDPYESYKYQNPYSKYEETSRTLKADEFEVAMVIPMEEMEEEIRERQEEEDVYNLTMEIAERKAADRIESIIPKETISNYKQNITCDEDFGNVNVTIRFSPIK